MSSFVAPQLVKSGPMPTDQTGWAWEVKFDGIRLQVAVEAGEVTVRTRPGRDATGQFPELAGLADALGRDAVLDGELVVLSEADGAPDFARLRARLSIEGPRKAALAAASSPAKLHAFDLLSLDGQSLLSRPLSERRQALESLGLDGRHWCVPRQFIDQGQELMAATRDADLEGVVAKRLDSPYRPGIRSASWLKYKHRRDEQLVVVAWSPAAAAEAPVFALSRRQDDGSLQFAGTASFGGAVIRKLHRVLPALEVPKRRPGLRPVKPVVEVVVGTHGRVGGPLRDAVIRSVASFR